MKCRPVLLLGLALAGTASSATPSLADALQVTVTNLRNSQGVVRCGLFNSKQTFGTPGREVAADHVRIRGGTAKCNFANVPSGVYAVAVFHAENNEKALEFGLFGKPKQGVGFSNNPSITFGAPGFDKTAFKLNGPSVSTTIRIQY